MSLFFPKKQGTVSHATTDEPFGTLLGLRHESSGGAMAYRSEFEIELTDREIVRCAYWPAEPASEMVRKEHVSLLPQQWTDVAETVRTLWPLMREVVSVPSSPLPPEVHVLDGGDYSRWFLTRQTPDGVRTAQYYQPDDRRICTLITLLQELAEPIGREIPRYDPPVLCGVYFQNEKQHCSYQCTPWDRGEDGYRFIVNDESKHVKRSLYERVPGSVWDAAFAFLEPLCLDRFPAGAFRDAVSCTLYYSDGKQKRVVPDKKTAEQLRLYFARLTDRVQKENSVKGDT